MYSYTHSAHSEIVSVDAVLFVHEVMCSDRAVLPCVCVTVVTSDGSVSRSRRSGRLLLPPLAFWASQRVVVPIKPGASTQLIQGADDTIADGKHVCFTESALVIIF